MKQLKSTKKYQLIRDGELFNRVYDYKWEAAFAGIELQKMGLIKDWKIYHAVANWLRVK